MTIQRARQDDVMGFLNERPIAIGVRSIFGGHSVRFAVLRYHAGRGVKPDPVNVEEKS